MSKVVKKCVPRSVDIVDITSKKSVSKEESQKKIVTPSRSHSSPVRFIRKAGRALSPRRVGRSLSPCRRRRNDKQERLGIEQSPFPVSAAQDDSTQQSSSSHRLGIQRGTYDALEEPHYGINLISPSSVQEEKKDREENEIVFEDTTAEPTPSIFRTAWSHNPFFASSFSKTKKTDYRSQTPEKAIHKPTAAGHYLTANARTPSPVHGLRYSLEKGTMKNQQEQASSPAAQKKVRVKDSKVTWTKDLPKQSKKKKTSFKVFLLLLQPDAKIFELIQLLYPPDTTKIGDILKMIPKNATEPALGAQKYIGLTRPKKKSTAFTDLSLFASNSMENSAGIEQGEILVAIPHGFAPRLMIRLSKQILANARIQKLLEQSDPLRKKKRSSRRSGSSSSKAVKTMESVAEEPAGEESSPGAEEDEPSPIKRAKTHAEAANAQVEKTSLNDFASPTKRIQDLVSPRSVSTPRSVRRTSLDSQFAAAEAPTPKSSGSRRQALGGHYEDESVDMASSFSSWSQSFDSSWVSRYSFATNVSTEASVASSRSVRLRRQRRLKVMANLKRSAIALVAILSVFYYMDPNGYAARGGMVETDNPMGLFGSASFVFALLALVKLQRLVQKPVGEKETKCPFLKFSLALLGQLKMKHQAVANGNE